MAINEVSIEDVKQHYEGRCANGLPHGHWFDAETMRFFNSRLAAVGYLTPDGSKAFFVTSERYDYSKPRLYTVRSYTFATRKMDTESIFQQYASSSGATLAAKRMAKAPQEVPA